MATAVISSTAIASVLAAAFIVFAMRRDDD
jgi:hypothetical protein